MYIKINRCCRLKLHYCVEDESGSSSVVFWDRLAVQLINKTASQFKFLAQEVNQLTIFFVIISVSGNYPKINLILNRKVMRVSCWTQLRLLWGRRSC